MTVEPVITAYLNALTVRVENALKDNLIGLYVSGSFALNDFRERSDIDVLAVSANSPPHEVKEKLAREISHENLKCPAAGLDFILADFGCVSFAPEISTFEFAISTGEKWKTEIEYSGIYDELLLDFAVCRKYGRTLYGPAPAEIFAVVPDERLKAILRKIIGWHRKHIFHPFHDPLGPLRRIECLPCVAVCGRKSFMFKNRRMRMAARPRADAESSQRCSRHSLGKTPRQTRPDFHRAIS